jgi:hypothetical protein
VLEVAEQLGHAPTMTLDVYGHVLAELAAQTKRPAADLIAEARERLAGGNGKGREASGTGCGMVAGAAWVVRMTD